MAAERQVAARAPIGELQTIQLLEETVAPRSLRDLRAAFEDESERRTLEALARGAADDLRELDDIVHTWRRLAGAPLPDARREEAAPDREEILLSLVELRDSEASILRRAAHDAPSTTLRERLLALAARAESASEKLKSLL